MGVKISKRFSSHSYSSFETKCFVKNPYDSPHKSYCLAFWNSKFKVFKKIEIFVNTGDYGDENFKTQPLLQILFLSTKLFLYVPCVSPHKSYL